MDKGIIWSRSEGFARDLISWHDMHISGMGNVRIWIHSRGEIMQSDFKYSSDEMSERAVYSFRSLEVQVQGKSFSAITETEKQARIELAKLSPKSTSGTLKASHFREIPIGQLEIDHMKCIKALNNERRATKKRGVVIVSSDKVPSILFKQGKIDESHFEKFIDSSLSRGTTENAIAVAKLYSDYSRMGVSKIVKQISIDTGLPSSAIYTCIRVARGQGWLSSEGVGKSGGKLEPLGVEAFQKLNGEEKLRLLLNAEKDIK